MIENRTRPVTEEEASKLWCPYARTSYSTLEEREQGGVNRLQGPNEASCIGSACMLWRWKNYGVSGEPTAPTGFCGAGGDPS